MKGLELAEKFYNEYGKKVIDENFSHIKEYLAIGLIGSGSECFGFDDEISRDHDFEPGFCIFLPDESLVSSKDEFELEKAYSKLPKEFEGFKRNELSPVGGKRHGVVRIPDFFENKTGSKNGDIHNKDWFFISEQFLLEATNGKIFCDNFGLITEIRERLIEIANEFLRPISKDLVFKVYDIRLVGSNAGYNYTDTSDVDLHMVVNLTEICRDCPEVVQFLFNAEKAKFNLLYDILLVR